jgi:hypothetical protein
MQGQDLVQVQGEVPSQVPGGRWPSGLDLDPGWQERQLQSGQGITQAQVQGQVQSQVQGLLQGQVPGETEEPPAGPAMMLPHGE